MNTEVVGLQSFVGGMSVDKKWGVKNQFHYGKHVDFRKNPGKLSVLPMGAEASNGVVTDLVEDMTQVTSGIRYALGNEGNVYKIAVAGTWSKAGDLSENGGAGIVFRADVDMVYFSGATKLGRIKKVSSDAAFEGDFFSVGVSADTDCFKAGGTNSYTLRTAPNEADADRRNFITDIEPIKKIGVRIKAKGSGNWTLVLHDEAHNVLATKTVTNANLSSNQVNHFEFSSPVRAQVSPNGRTYHFHVYSTVADGTIYTANADTMADCDMELWANALIDTANGLHPIFNFINLTLIGNERYVAAYEPLQDLPTTADFLRHRLTLPPGFEVCGFGQKNQFCLIVAEKRSTSGEFQEGAVFIWDGISETYNDWFLVPEGSPEAMFTHKNVGQYIAGGDIYRMVGLEQPTKVRAFRNTDSEFSGVADSTHVNPNMMTVRRGILLMGYPTQTTNESLEFGVYSLGSVSREYPESFGLSYSLSTGSLYKNDTNNLRIGMVKNFGDTLYVSWRDNDNARPFGVDVINNSSPPASSFVLESLYYDGLKPFKYKQAIKILLVSNPLPADCEIRLKYKIDEEANWHYSDDDDSTAKATESSQIFTMGIDKSFIGIEFGLEGTCGAITPEIRGLFLLVDPRETESEVN